jgi:hypothetical protein
VLLGGGMAASRKWDFLLFLFREFHHGLPLEKI